MSNIEFLKNLNSVQDMSLDLPKLNTIKICLDKSAKYEGYYFKMAQIF
jgi:hypothetical protein